MSQQAEDQSGFIMYLTRQSLAVRLTAFIMFVIFIVGLIVAIAGGLYYANIVNFPRLTPTAVDESVTVQEFAVFDDEDAYPSAVASFSDGALVTGSFASGAVWMTNDDGNLFEIDGSRDQIGSVIGIDVADDIVFILDQGDALNPTSAKIWQYDEFGLSLYLDFSSVDSITVPRPNDIAVDSLGRLFVLDILTGEIILVNRNDASVWWSRPDNTYQIAGLVYNAANDSLLISDANRDAIYEIPASADDPENARQTIYTLLDSSAEAPGFNGLTVDNSGTIYVAALNVNEVWAIEPRTDRHTLIAGNYRGSSDVAYDAANDRLYVNNWDQSWLIPVTLVVIQVDVPPRLPFSVDMIELAG